MKNFGSCCFLIFLVSTFYSCNKNAEAQETEEKIEAAMKKYKAQKHRFEIRECKLFYNEQQLILDSLESFERILGNHYKTVGYTQNYYIDNPVEYYIKACNTESIPRPCIKMLNILMSYEKDNFVSEEVDSIRALRPILDGYILFDSIPVNAQTCIEDLNKQLKAKGKHPLAPLMRNNASHAIRYDGEYCTPAYNCQEPCLTTIRLYYYENEKTGELGNIQTLRYEY